MTSDSNCKCVQIISGTGEFLSENFGNCFLEQIEKRKKVFMVSIIGEQSSGKSTLLNELFNTGFKVMDATKDISRTTDGIWISQCISPKNLLLLMDVEGRGGIEKGEKGKTFEKQAMLLALALPDVLIVNIKFKDLGSADEICLFQTVFETSLKMNNMRTKGTTLLFVVRDYKAATPINVVEGKISKKLKAVWDGIEKPSGAPYEEFFNVVVYGLPDLMPDGVPTTNTAPLKELQRYFVDTNHPQFLLKPALCKNYGDVVEIATLCKDIWRSIAANRELDVESQRVLITRNRCSEVCKEVRGGLRTERLRMEGELDSGISDKDFRPEMQAAVEKWKKVFEDKAPKAVKEVYEEEARRIAAELQTEYEWFAGHQEAVQEQRKKAAEEKAHAEAAAEQARAEQERAHAARKAADEKRAQLLAQQETERREAAARQEAERKRAEAAAREAARVRAEQARIQQQAAEAHARREAAERAERERAEREYQERLRREAQQRADRERAERETRERLQREAAQREAQRQAEIREQQRRMDEARRAAEQAEAERRRREEEDRRRREEEERRRNNHTKRNAILGGAAVLLFAF